MTRVLDSLLARGGSWPPFASELVRRGRDVLKGCLEKDDYVVSGDGGRPHAGATLIDVPPERLLDVAADLLDAASLLQAAGELAEGFAIEGIQGRVLEALVGAGRIEVPARTSP